MDVSDRASGASALVGLEGSDGATSQAAGPALIQELMTLTGLPEPLIPRFQSELGRILESAGQSPATLTLDDLRVALLAYLDSFEVEDLDSSSEPITVHDC